MAPSRPPAIPRVKSCLKNSPPQSPGGAQGQCTGSNRKSVAFCEEGSEQVFPADEWDRTPAETAQKLSYQDILELKEIQRSLPRANQPRDPLSRMSHSQHYLSTVPIGLLPLLPDDQPSPRSMTPAPSPSISRTSSTSSLSTTSSLNTTSSFSSTITDVTRGRPKPAFSFLPLLDTPNPGPPEPKTFAEFEAMLEEELGLSTPSLTHDSPSTRASSLSSEVPHLDLHSSPRHSPPSSPHRSYNEPPSPRHKQQTYTQKHGSTQGAHSPPLSSLRLRALSDTVAHSNAEPPDAHPPNCVSMQRAKPRGGFVFVPLNG